MSPVKSSMTKRLIGHWSSQVTKSTLNISGYLKNTKQNKTYVLSFILSGEVFLCPRQEAGKDDLLMPLSSVILLYFRKIELDFQKSFSLWVCEVILWNWSSFYLSISTSCSEISRYWVLLCRTQISFSCDLSFFLGFPNHIQKCVRNGSLHLHP